MKKNRRTSNKSLGAYIGNTVNDESVKTSSLMHTGKQNPRKKLSEKEYKKRKAQRKNLKNRRRK
jgi:hypothetical protein